MTSPHRVASKYNLGKSCVWNAKPRSVYQQNMTLPTHSGLVSNLIAQDNILRFLPMSLLSHRSVCIPSAGNYCPVETAAAAVLCRQGGRVHL